MTHAPTEASNPDRVKMEVQLEKLVEVAEIIAEKFEAYPDLAKLYAVNYKVILDLIEEKKKYLQG